MMNRFRIFSIIAFVMFLMSSIGNAQSLTCADQGTWAGFNFPYNSPNGAIDIPILLTDGRVMVQYIGLNGTNFHQFQDWYALTPDPMHGGCYEYNSSSCGATWSELASLDDPTIWAGQYGPYGYASAVLPNGKVFVQGGENNLGIADWTTDGAIFDPTVGSQGAWTQLNPPVENGVQWASIGDAQSVVLPNGHYMVAACGTSEASQCDSTQPLAKHQAIYDQTGQLLSIVGSGKLDRNAEEGWTLLPGPQGNILTIDTKGNNNNAYEIFDTTNLTWSNPGSTPVQIYGDFPGTGDIGPAILMADGKVLATGAPPHHLLSSPALTAIFTPPSTWVQGPTFPVVPGIGGHSVPIGMGDRAAALLPDGNVFLAATDTLNTYYFYEYTASGTGGTGLCSIATPNNLPNIITGHNIRMLLLPSGQVFVTVGGGITEGGARPDYYIYTPSPNYGPLNPWRPQIGSVNNGNPISPGVNGYLISGTQFNGLSQGTYVGDEFQNASNYPLVQITDSQNHVFYARTHDHSTMAVATGLFYNVHTSFDVPSTSTGIASGNATVKVIANGIASSGHSVCISLCSPLPQESQPADPPSPSLRQ